MVRCSEKAEATVQLRSVPQIYGDVTQLVECRCEVPMVAGSNPVITTAKCRRFETVCDLDQSPFCLINRL